MYSEKMSQASGKVNASWLLVFSALYPFVFIPSGLFFSPGVIDDSVLQEVFENFFLLPKIFFMGVFSVLGVLAIRKTFNAKIFAPLIILHIVFVLLGILNSSDSLAFSLLGPQRRLDGLLYHCFLALLAISTYFTVISNPQILNKFTRILFFVCIIQTIILLLQRFDLDPVNVLLFKYVNIIPETSGTLSNPGYLAVLFLPAMILNLFYTFENKDRNTKWYHSIGMGFIGVGLSLTDNRTAVFAFILVLLIFTVKNFSLINIFKSSFLVFLIVFSPLLLPKTNQSTARGFGNSTTLYTRLQIWQIAADLLPKIPSFPILGGGVDAFRLTLLNDFPMEQYVKLLSLELEWGDYEINSTRVILPDNQIRLSALEINFKKLRSETNVTKIYPIELDRAYNLLLDRFISFGILNALLWGTFFIYPMWLGWQSKAKSFAFFISMSLFALFLYYFLWFPSIQTEPIHVVIIASGWALGTLKKTESIALFSS
jgi:O-antigen ligase